MDEGISRLEARLEALTCSLEEMEARLRALEDRVAADREDAVSAKEQEAQSGVETETRRPDGSRAVSLLSLVGQVCLVLCGAFLLRAMTDMAVLPTAPGLALGLVYAIGWLLFADFLARGDNTLGATFFGSSSVVIAYPLISEAATTFDVLGGVSSAVTLTLFTALALGMAWRRNLQALAWLTVLFVLGTVFVLVIGTREMVPFALALLLLGVSTLWITHSRGWLGLQWLPGAAAAVLNSFIIHLASRPHGIPPESYNDVTVPWAMTLALALLFVYLTSFAVQTLVLRRDVSIFETVQTTIVLIIGFVGAVHVANASGIGSIALGAGALMFALAYYIVAFALAELRWGYGKNHGFYAWLAFVLSLAGFLLVADGLALLLSWCVLSVAMAVLGARFKRVTLYYQSAAYAVAAAILAADVPGGLITLAIDVFTLPADETWPQVTVPGLLIVITAVTSYVVLALAQTDPEHPWRFRIPSFLVALLAAMGAGAMLVVIISGALGSHPPEADAGIVAAVRTSIVAVAAVALAAISRIPASADLRWLVYPLFLFGALKLALEDLPNGRPSTLFVAFAFYGVALIIAPRLARSDQHRGETPPQARET